jgi:pimeloyl-ACP methyl ester carboxylesterase
LFSHARDLIDLLDRLALGPAALVGVSMGGAVATEATMARPDLVSALVLVGSGLRGHQFSEQTVAGWEDEEAALERGDLDAAVETNLRMWVDGPHRSPEDVDPDVRRRVGEMQRRAFEIEQSTDGDARLDELVPDLATRLGEIQAPTLILVGELDRPEMHEIADRLEAEIPNTRRATIGGTAHVPSMERPQEFDELVLGFLAEQR